MQSVYGASGYQLILAKSRELASSVPHAKFYALDDGFLMGQLAAAKDNTAPSLSAALGQLTRIPPAPNNSERSILILGDHRIFPYFEVPNPVQDRIDPDPNVLTDNPYGSGGSQNPGDWLRPDLLPVGRIAAGVQIRLRISANCSTFRFRSGRLARSAQAMSRLQAGSGRTPARL